ncbi:MAG: hypothetical protein M0Z71_12455 [Nitrospiraceae bacterium]|nr:hypothetical protein [Nitrospiraceae bacterium]
MLFGKKTIRCPNCKYEGIGEYKAKGHFCVEIVLWCCFLLPGIIYSVWRGSSRRWICPQCGFENVVKTGSMPSGFSFDRLPDNWVMTKGQAWALVAGIAAVTVLCLTVIFPAMYRAGYR